MKPAFLVIVVVVSSLTYLDRNSRKPMPPDARIGWFDLTDAILRDGLSELSLKNVDGLHLGFEEIIRDRIQDDPRGGSVHFSMHLEKSRTNFVNAEGQERLRAAVKLRQSRRVHNTTVSLQSAPDGYSHAS
jgi:hypothetical protein